MPAPPRRSPPSGATPPPPRTERSDDPGPFLDRLHDPDPQIRLNAAVRLAYLGRPEGLADLLEGLAHESFAIRFTQVPDALARLGDAGTERLQGLAGAPGPTRLGAARALLLRRRLGGVPEAVVALLGAPDHPTRWAAAALAGELGPAAGAPAADALRRALEASGPELSLGPQALAAVAGAAALPVLRRELERPTPTLRTAAMRGLAGLGPAAAEAAPQLQSAVGDAGVPLGERVAAAQTLVRVGPSGDTVLAALQGALPRADRWLAIGLLRTLAQLGPAYPLRPEAADRWPAWESRLALRAPVLKPVAPGGALLRTLVEHLGHPDHDLRRAAALGLALSGAADGAVPAVREADLPEPLRHDVLRRLGAPAALDPAGFPWDQAMRQPPVDLDAIAAACEARWAGAAGGALDAPRGVPAWAFLQYLVQRFGVLLHGSRKAGLAELRPVSRSGGGTLTSDQPGVFAVDHALMAMYFGVIDRSKVPSLSNSLVELTAPDGARVRGFRLGLDFVALASRPFVHATVYVLPPDTFSRVGEWTSLVPVRPLAGVAITPEEFPLLEDLWGTDLGPLAAQFTDQHPGLQDAAFWVSKRSARSATR